MLAVAGLVLAAFTLYPTAVPDDLSLGRIDVDSLFGAHLVERARDYERFFYVDWVLAAGRAPRHSLDLCKARSRIRPRIVGGADRHGDAPRDARPRDRVARARSIRARRALVAAPLGSERPQLPRLALPGLGGARGPVPLDLRRAAHRHGARAKARRPLVAAWRGRVRGHRRPLLLRRPVPRLHDDAAREQGAARGRARGTRRSSV